MKNRVIIMLLLSIVNIHCGRATSVSSLLANTDLSSANSANLLIGSYVYKNTTCNGVASVNYINSLTFQFTSTSVNVSATDPTCTGVVLQSVYSVTYSSGNIFNTELLSSTSYSGACVATTTNNPTPIWGANPYSLVGNILSLPAEANCFDNYQRK